MAKADPSRTVTLSILDRLVDDKPESASEAPVSRAQSVRVLKAGLRRDLEWLLNTRRNPEAAPESMAELSRSLYNYGLPDFASLTIAAPKDRDRLLLELETTVALFEPRLKDVRITLLDAPNGYIRTLHFQIEGMLQMDPSPEQVSFDTVLQLTSGEYQIRGERGA
jgi:type VI secretion system protein ImpF